MLDTHARKYVQPVITHIAKGCIRLNLTPIKLTLLALLIGLGAAVLNMFNLPILAVILLWISGLIDTLDGTVARLNHQKSDLGAFLDITFDRVVELSVLYSFLIRAPELSGMLFVLCSTFLFSITVFLTVRSMSNNHTEKAFYYQAGITERTETFIFFTLMMIFIDYADIIGYIFAGLVLVTVFMRLYEGIKILKD